MERIFYRGDSMKRVFRPGDEIFAEPVAASACRAGDIVIFTDPAAGRIIHRVIATTPDGAQTMGDNNDAPDPGLRRDGDELLLACAFLRRGKRHRLARGAAGMRAFRRHRRRRAFRRFCGRFFRRFFHPLAGFRRPLFDATEGHSFGEVLHCEWRGHLVARRWPDGRIRFTHWYWRLFFAPPPARNTSERKEAPDRMS